MPKQNAEVSRAVVSRAVIQKLRSIETALTSKKRECYNCVSFDKDLNIVPLDIGSATADYDKSLILVEQISSGYLLSSPPYKSRILGPTVSGTILTYVYGRGALTKVRNKLHITKRCVEYRPEGKY